MRQAEYVNDKETGNVSEFNSNGIRIFQQKGRLENGKLTGIKYFFNKDPGRIWIEEYVNSRVIKSYWNIKKQGQTHP
jgi:antitoxin component YwqK of YwqJK toxin-antitoxin module